VTNLRDQILHIIINLHKSVSKAGGIEYAREKLSSESAVRWQSGGILNVAESV
jgi:hypothetical protein